MERGRIEGLPIRTFLVSIGTKALYKFREKYSRWRLRGLSKLFRAPIYWAHRAVVFAIARLSCSEFTSC